MPFGMRRKLPGWGEEGPEWDALDQEGQGAAAEDSKISAEVQLLSLDDNGNVGSQASHAGTRCPQQHRMRVPLACCIT